LKKFCKKVKFSQLVVENEREIIRDRLFKGYNYLLSFISFTLFRANSHSFSNSWYEIDNIGALATKIYFPLFKLSSCFIKRALSNLFARLRYTALPIFLPATKAT